MRRWVVVVGCGGEVALGIGWVGGVFHRRGGGCGGGWWLWGVAEGWRWVFGGSEVFFAAEVAVVTVGVGVTLGTGCGRGVTRKVLHIRCRGATLVLFCGICHMAGTCQGAPAQHMAAVGASGKH